MEIKAFIKSGILEAYLAGELDNAQMLEVDKMAFKHPEIQDELNAIRDGVNQYAEAEDKKPSKDILRKTLLSIKESEKEQFLQILEGEEVKIKRVNVVPGWSIAASILLVMSLGFNYMFYNEFKKAKDQLAVLESNQETLANQVNNGELELQYAELRIAHFLSEDNIHVRMDGLDQDPELFANVFWNKNNNSVFISVDNLPEPPHGHQYQLWAIKPGTAPIDAGIFDHSKLVQELKVIKGNVQAFAVTLEKEGGSPVATVEKTFVKGFLKKS